MYGNLEAEISRRRMPKYVLAQKIGVSAYSVPKVKWEIKFYFAGSKKN